MTTLNPKRSRFRLAALIAIPMALVSVGLAWAHQHGGPHGGMFSAQGIEMHLDHVQAMLGKVGASDAQKSQIDGILRGAFGEFRNTHDEHHSALAQLHELLLAPNVDRAKIEALRAGQVKSLDAASKRLISSIEDAVDVLTPEQRSAFWKEVQQHHSD